MSILIIKKKKKKKNPEVGIQSLLLGILQTQGLNLGFPHCRKILHCLSHPGSLSFYSKFLQM